MKVGQKVTFYDENHKKHIGLVIELHAKNQLDIQITRKPGASQLYLKVPLKDDVPEGVKNFYYTTQEPTTQSPHQKEAKSIFSRKPKD